jgi:hypothetical protein
MKKLKKLKDNINIWYMIEIKPSIIRFLKEQSLTLKKWRYINDIPTVKELIDEIKENHEFNKHLESYDYFTGVVRSVPPIELNKGKAVMTPHGIGRMQFKIFDDITGNLHKVVVEIMTVDYRKSRGYIKYLKLSDITQLTVYHEPSNQTILISPKDYVYIADTDEPITYRVTKRKYATLSPDYKANIGYIKLFHEERGGANLLRRLHAKGYVIIKQ